MKLLQLGRKLRFIFLLPLCVFISSGAFSIDETKTIELANGPGDYLINPEIEKHFIDISMVKEIVDNTSSGLPWSGGISSSGLSGKEVLAMILGDLYEKYELQKLKEKEYQETLPYIKKKFGINVITLTTLEKIDGWNKIALELENADYSSYCKWLTDIILSIDNSDKELKKFLLRFSSSNQRLLPLLNNAKIYPLKDSNKNIVYIFYSHLNKNYPLMTKATFELSEIINDVLKSRPQSENTKIISLINIAKVELQKFLESVPEQEYSEWIKKIASKTQNNYLNEIIGKTENVDNLILKEKFKMYTGLRIFPLLTDPNIGVDYDLNLDVFCYIFKNENKNEFCLYGKEHASRFINKSIESSFMELEQETYKMGINKKDMHFILDMLISYGWNKTSTDSENKKVFDNDQKIILEKIKDIRYKSDFLNNFVRFLTSRWSKIIYKAQNDLSAKSYENKVNIVLSQIKNSIQSYLMSYEDICADIETLLYMQSRVAPEEINFNCEIDKYTKQIISISFFPRFEDLFFDVIEPLETAFRWRNIDFRSSFGTYQHGYSGGPIITIFMKNEYVTLPPNIK